MDQNEDQFDWYQDYNKLRDVITQFIPKSPETIILNIGCGNSTLSEKMFNEGYRFQINIDKAQDCINMMRKKLPNMPQTFQCNSYSFT